MKKLIEIELPDNYLAAKDSDRIDVMYWLVGHEDQQLLEWKFIEQAQEPVAWIREEDGTLHPARPEREGWQPIETAPKDGSEILCITNHGAMFVICYDPAYSKPWRVLDDYGLTNSDPVGWTPLPAAPTGNGGV